MKTAIIIKGNQKHIKGKNSFYLEIKKFLEKLGYKVKFDKGLPYTSPPKADLWIGHSMGADRLEGAKPKYAKEVLGIGVPFPSKQNFKVINHPKDEVNKGIINNYHFVFDKKMKNKIKNLDKKISRLKTNPRQFPLRGSIDWIEESAENSIDDFLEKGSLEIIKALKNATLLIISQELRAHPKFSKKSISNYTKIIEIINIICGHRYDTRQFTYRDYLDDGEEFLFLEYLKAIRSNYEGSYDNWWFELNEFFNESAEYIYNKAKAYYDQGDKLESLKLICAVSAIIYYAEETKGTKIHSKKQYEEAFDQIAQEIAIGVCS